MQLFRLRFLSSAYWRGKMPLVARVSFFLNFGGDVIFVPLKVLVLFWPTLVALLPQGYRPAHRARALLHRVLSLIIAVAPR